MSGMIIFCLYFIFIYGTSICAVNEKGHGFPAVVVYITTLRPLNSAELNSVELNSAISGHLGMICAELNSAMNKIYAFVRN